MVLKKCPFCGSDAILMEVNGLYTVECINEDCTAHVYTKSSRSKQMAANAWNTRRSITGNEYQELAARTINNALTHEEQTMHSLHGMVGEIGELHSLYQKVYQEHELDMHHAMSEVSDLLWFIAEYCTANGLLMGEVMKYNIEKLKKRYPEGFSSEHSLHRKEGDI